MLVGKCSGAQWVLVSVVTFFQLSGPSPAWKFVCSRIHETAAEDGFEARDVCGENTEKHRAALILQRICVEIGRRAGSAVD